MDTRGAFRGIGHSNEEVSMPELLLREYVLGRISEREYHVSTAVWVSDHLVKYPPRPYPAVSGPLQDYVTRRLDGGTARDPGMSFRLGQWLFSVQSYQSQNSGDSDLLAWCFQKLSDARLTKHADAITSHALRFALPLPSILGAAFRVQAMDMADKIRNERGQR